MEETEVATHAQSPYTAAGDRQTRPIAAFLVALVAAILVPVANAPQAAAAETLLYAPYPAGTTYRVSQGFDGPGHSGTTNSKKGLDFATGNGKVIAASAPGTVRRAHSNCANVKSECNGGLGNYVEVRHADGRCTIYAHLSRVDVKVDQTVGQAAKLGLTGTSGRSSGPHLHFHVVRCGSLTSQAFKLVEYSGSYAHNNIWNRNITSKNGAKPTRTTVTMDEPARHGEARWWIRRTGTTAGYDGDYWLTLSAGKKYAKDVVYAIWQTSATLYGKYEVRCFVPKKEAIGYAKYRVSHRDGTAIVVRHQKTIYGWTSLGTYTFNARGNIRLGDATGYNDYNQYIGFDACQWIPR